MGYVPSFLDLDGFSFEWFGQDVGDIALRGNFLNRNVSFLDVITQEVVTNFDVFSTRVLNGVFTQVMAPLLSHIMGMSSRCCHSPLELLSSILPVDMPFRHVCIRLRSWR